MVTPRYIVERELNGGKYRYILPAADIEQAREKAELSQEKIHGKILNITELKPEWDLVKQILNNKLVMWELIRKLEQMLGMELGNIDDTTDFICIGMDVCLTDTEHEELLKHTTAIINDRTD